jgi:selenocysteine lyase/cysteine desulfurase
VSLVTLPANSALAKLRGPWYAGGNITFSSVQASEQSGRGFYRTPGAAGFEDGTLDYLGIPAVSIGLRHITAIGLDTIHTRVMCLAGWLLDALARRHSNGMPMIRLYGPQETDVYRFWDFACGFRDVARADLAEIPG